MENRIRTRKRKPFIMLSHDFIRGELLDWNEKNIYMILLTYANSEKQCFPSIETLSETFKKSDRTVRKTIRSLEEKGMLEKEVRITKKGQISNLYTLNDYEDVWEAKTVKEAKELISIEEKKKKLYELASELNFEVTEKKEPVLSEPTKVTDKTDSQQLTQEKYIVETEKSQEVEEKYPLEWLKNHYEYEQMVAECPEEQETIDNVMQILHEDINTSAKTIRVGKENKPKEAYISKMMKLTSKGILYAIKKYKEAKEPIGNTTNYMRTLLYRAEEQRHLDNLNKQSIQSNQYNNDQGGSLPFDRDKPMHMTKSAEAYNNYSQRQHSQEYWDDLEQQLLALSVPT